MLSRRVFLADLGVVSLGAVVLGACSGSDGAAPSTSAASTPPTSTGAKPSAAGTPSTTATLPAPLRRVDLGFVSAYVVVRDGEAAIVDTGVAGSADAIGTVLRAIGRTWTDVGTVVLTHKHDDHAGSLPEVLAMATGAKAWTGAADVSAVQSRGVSIAALNDGQTIFGLRVVATPGHTPGHISLLDAAAGFLIAGDAINGADGGVAGPNPSFSEDLATAKASARKLGTLTYDTVVFGHGDPVVGDASSKVAALAKTL